MDRHSENFSQKGFLENFSFWAPRLELNICMLQFFNALDGMEESLSKNASSAIINHVKPKNLGVRDARKTFSPRMPIIAPIYGSQFLARGGGRGALDEHH